MGNNAVNGWLIVNKPENFSSAKAVWFAKKSLDIKKIGHAGTLDPLACGVLPLAIGEATKTTRFLVDQSKDYKFTVKWGVETSTADREGEITKEIDYYPSESEIINIIGQFIGEIDQTPPVYSAIKINGKRACDRVRSGETVEIKSRKITIFNLSMIDCDSKSATFETTCSKGTYVRSLATDIAKALNTCGHVTYLQRTRVGAFRLKDSILLEMNTKPVYNQEWIDKILPVEQVLDDIPVLSLSDESAKKIAFGQKLICDKDYEENQFLIAKNSGKLVAICQVKENLLKPVRVFNL